MKFSLASAISLALITLSCLDGVDAQYTGNMVKLCLFYKSHSGTARTDPIITDTCVSDHVHTFYGPQNFHPDTTYNDLINTDPKFSSTPWIENQSLYWHPSIYEVVTNNDGTKTYTRVDDLESSPYYRWDNSVSPPTEAFPPEFRMIAYSNKQGAGNGDGEAGGNIFVECCDYDANGNEDCTTEYGTFKFPQKNCAFLGFSFGMPTCWNGDLGKDNDHISHMSYTDDGTVAGNCPADFSRRLPQIQFFVRIPNYKGASRGYILSDESTNDAFHVDFMNGWQDGVLQDLIDNCPIRGSASDGYNPPCSDLCVEDRMTENTQASGPVCDSDVRKLIVDEATDVMSSLPRTSCSAPMIPKSWETNPPLDCEPTDNDDTSNDDTSNDDTSNDDTSNDDSTEDDNDDGEECVDGDKFFWRRKNEQVQLQTCVKLAEKSDKVINNFCTKRVAYAEKNGMVYGPPNAVCKDLCESCDSCYQNNRSRFHHKNKTKNCTWLGKRTSEIRNRLCAKDGNGLWPSASEVCPQTCKVAECALG